MSLFQALDESEKSPGHGWNTSSRFGLDSTNGGGKQYDSQGSSTNIFHHLINQNNTGEVPDALAEEEVINDNEVQTDCSFNLNQQQQQKQQQQQNQQHMQQIQQQQQNALQHQFQQQQMQKQHLLNQQHQQQKHAMMNTPKQVLPQPSPRGKTPQQQQQQQQQHKSPYPVLNNNKQQQQHTQLDQQQQHQLLQQQQLQTQFARQQQQQQSMQQQMLSQAQSQSARLQQQHAAQQQMISQAQMQNRLLQQQQQQVLKQQPGQNINMQQGVGRNKPLPQPHHNQLVQQQLSQQLVKNSVEKIEEDLNRQLLQTEQEIEENNKKLAMFGLPPVSVQHSQLPTMNNCDYLGSVRVNHSGNQAGSGDGRIRTMLTHSKETLQKKGNINVMDNSAPVNQNVQRQTISHGQVGGQISGQQPRTPIITVSAGQRLNLPPQSQMVRSPMKSGIVQLPSPSMPGNRPTSAPTQSPVQVQTVSTNQSLIRQPPPASAMMKINKSNVVLEGGGQFEEGQAYVIKDRHGNSRTMVWTNGEFVPYDKDKGNYNQIQHSTIDSSQRGRGARGGRGGRAARGRGQLQGNPTGVHMTQNLQGNSPLMNNGLRQVHPNGPINKTMSYQGPGHPQYHQQIGQMSTPGHVIHQSQSTPNLISVVTTPSAPGQVSVQRPKLALQNLMPAQQIKQKSGDTGQNEVPPSTSAEKVEQMPAATTIIAVVEKDTPVLDPPNVPDEPTACAVCQFCGTTSMDKYKCESCKRMFTSATKYVIPKHDGEGEIKRRKLEPPNTVAILTAGVDKNVFYPRKLVDQGEVYLKVISTTNTVTSKTPRIIRSSVAGRGRRGRGRGRGMAVPELVTISSDEEDGGDPNLSVSRSAPATPVPSRSPSQHGDQLEGPELIPIIPVSKRVDKARVKKMEDAEGANARENSPSPPAQFTLTARTIRVGTFRGAPVEPVLISQNGLSFFIEGVTGTHRFVLFPQEIQQCLAKFDSEPNLIFFLTNEGCAGRTRKDLGMAVYSDHTKPPPELYFNPSSLEMRHQMITIVSDQLSVETRLEFQKYMELFKSWGKQGDEAFFMELSKEEADEIYRQSTTTSPLTHFTICTTSFSQGEEDRQGDRSPSPKIGFVGPVIKLLTYPPPPEKGGISITNEDLYCLQEGEFLNDVIIDFYLKYLLRDKLSAEDRERTHIFSSFFYKRLTQRIRGATIDEDPNITLAEKRHARVKTWTKHVDLFKKDFIVVPINEHAHWFLAIICFPSLDKPVENPFIPKLVSNTFLDTASVPTPPQPTEDGQEDMETEESEDPYNEMEAGAQQVKKEKQEEVAASETNGQTKELTVEKDKVDKQSTETEQPENQSEEKTESQSDSQAEKSEDQSDKSESQSEKASTQSDSDGTNTETAESQSEKQNCGKEESNSSNSSEKASEKSNVIQKADGTPAEKSVTKVAKVPKTPVLVRSIRGKAIPKSDPLPPEASVGIRQPCIIIFDSLVGPSRSRIIQVLKEYLQVEWAVKKGGTELNKGMIKGCSAKVQQQTNYSDCGVYMLQYVESFFEDPIQDFSIPVRLVDWFSIPKIEAKREEIRDLVIGLKEKYESKNNT